MEKEVVKEELVTGPQEHAKKDTTGQEDMDEGIVMEDAAKQPPTGKGSLFYKFRELKRKVSSHLPCIS